MADDRGRLRVTFDSVAQHYQDSRPDYPAELFDELTRRLTVRMSPDWANGSDLGQAHCKQQAKAPPAAGRGLRLPREAIVPVSSG
jgi:hypothetical protein